MSGRVLGTMTKSVSTASGTGLGDRGRDWKRLGVYASKRMLRAERRRDSAAYLFWLRVLNRCNNELIIREPW